MARIGEVLSYKRVTTESGVNISDIQVNFGGNVICTARHYQPPGDDSYPLVGDFCVCIQAGSEWIAHAFIDPELTAVAQEGERVLFSRSALGTVEAKLPDDLPWLG